MNKMNIATRIAISALIIIVSGCGFLAATGHVPEIKTGGFWRARDPGCEPKCGEERQMLMALARQLDDDKTIPLVVMR